MKCKLAEINRFSEAERWIIAQAHQQLNEAKHEKKYLVNEFEALLKAYEKLHKLFSKVSSISDTHSHVIRQREMDIQNLLDHVNQGFLTVDSKGVIHRPYSRVCEQILQCKPLRGNITELLWRVSPEEQMHVLQTLPAILQATTTEESNRLLQQLPSMVNLGDKRIKVEYKRITGDEELAPALLIIMTDLTEQLESQEKLRYLSYHDPLTSLHNRYYIEQVLSEGVLLQQLPLSILVMDMNGLKLVNDVFGHNAGDQLIRQMAQLLRRELDPTSVMARWGGDEFVVLLPHTNEETAKGVVSRLKKACEASPADPIRLKVAIGLSEWDLQEQRFEMVFDQAEKHMYREKYLIRGQMKKDILEEASAMLYKRGIEAEGHYERLYDQARGFTGYLNVDPASKEMKLLGDLVRVHDAGKLAIPDSILLKTAPLLAEEWETIKNHSVIGSRFAVSLGEWGLAEMIESMHERWDGTGYPNGLVGNQIPYLSRILAILDAYDVITHDQAYRKAQSPQYADEQIKAAAGTQFDPELVHAFFEWKALG